ncbi:MAG: phospholipase A [Gammaproteobacteria bacterium]
MPVSMLYASDVPAAAVTGAQATRAPTELAQPAPPNPFNISLYKPNYLIPYSYMTSPDRAVYAGHSPDGEQISHSEVQFQISLKVPVLADIAKTRVSLYGAYTQTSFWQAYNRSAFFRESDYEPEVFLEYSWQRPLPGGWQWQLADLGFVHQSNGQGGTLERSWNRVYLSGTLVRQRWTVYLQAWHAIRGAGLLQHNPDISRYLGYGKWRVTYHRGRQSFSLMSRNNLTSGFSRGAWKLSWSFPLVQKLNGYVQVFSGYGQSLLEYNHRTTAVGVGVAIKNW